MRSSSGWLAPEPICANCVEPEQRADTDSRRGRSPRGNATWHTMLSLWAVTLVHPRNRLSVFLRSLPTRLFIVAASHAHAAGRSSA